MISSLKDIYFRLRPFWWAASASARVGTIELNTQVVRSQKNATALLRIDVCCVPKLPARDARADKPKDMLRIINQH